MPFRLEFLTHPTQGPVEFETRADLDATLMLIRGCPITDGPVRLRVTELREVSSEHITIEHTNCGLCHGTGVVDAPLWGEYDPCPNGCEVTR